MLRDRSPPPLPGTGRITGSSDGNSTGTEGNADAGKGGGSLSWPGRGGGGSPALVLEGAVSFPTSPTNCNAAEIAFVKKEVAILMVLRTAVII